MAVHETVPLLHVTDMERSLAFYESIGFTCTDRWAPDGAVRWCRLQYDDAAIMLQQGREGFVADTESVLLFFICDDADSLYQQLAPAVPGLQPPQTAFYGMRQLELRDPDGYLLHFEHEV